MYIWENDLKNYLEQNKDKKIIIWGIDEKARVVAGLCKENQLVCYVGSAEKEGYFEGVYVCSKENVGNFKTDSVILADDGKDIMHVYNSIRSSFHGARVNILNLWGKEIDIYVDKINELVCNYGNLNENKLYERINNNNVFAVDLDNTLLADRSFSCEAFYKDIEIELLKLYPGCKLYSVKMLEYRMKNKYISLKNLTKQVITDEKMGSVDWNTVWEIIYKEIKNHFYFRMDIVSAINYAVKNNKLVCIIEDMTEYRLDKEFIEKLLKDAHIYGINALICSTEIGVSKKDDIWNNIKLRYGDIPCIYIGDEIYDDMYMSQVYGLEPFWVMSPYKLYQSKENFIDIDLKNPIICNYFEEFLKKYYLNTYIMNNIETNNVYKEDLQKLKMICEFEHKFSYSKGDELYLNKLQLFSEPNGQLEKLVFDYFSNPKVSIVIPVFNQFVYTYNCLKSILKHSENVPYEIIIADDCSTDQVKEIERVVSGITVLHNKKNLKFLRNCNNAATHAKGEYILFLNNDTQVQPGWLKPMVDLMEHHPEVGMTGAKLVYPNGCLQEAGGILWKDGSAWNYGHMKNPTEPDFCYVKETDYISGAAIMIRTSLWKEIGGFDEAFAPAYYEDTDLAFEVRKHGYKVMLQPESIVVHFEGVSNGTDTSTGLKSYQIVNQKKFFEKWKDVLGKYHFENGTNVYLAKDRGQMKKQILVVDHYVPNYDHDAGGRCTYMYMKAFLNLGMKVTFIGDNFAKPEPYTTALNQLGIEVLYGDYYCMHWQEWLKDNLKHFDYIYLQRPHISIKYIDLVKEYGRGKIFYFAHDLHHIRMYRDYLVSGNKEALKESRHWKKIEMELFEKADVGHVVGSYEQEVMRKAFPDKPIRNIPLYIYNDEPERIEKDFSKRKDILFVGGFKHAPNVDAVLWFGKEIFPRILEKYPDIIWHIVGSSAPDEVKALANDNIIIEGFVTDEELGEMYRKYRMVVVPLRYGAGVKGKIVEAAYYQIPVVTTAIGGEGLDSTVGSFVMEEEAEKMALLIESLYTDYDKLRKMSDAGETMIQKYFTSKVAENVLLEDMNLL